LEPTANNAKAVTIAAVIGAISGAVSFLAYAASARNYSVELFLWIAIFGPGIIYGLALGFYLLAIRRATLLRAVALVPLVAGAWYPAIRSITIGPELIGYSGQVWLAGLFAGTVWATGVVVAMWLLLRFFRRGLAVAVTILIGAAAGTSAGLPIASVIAAPLVFILWQAGVTACIGWAAVRATEQPSMFTAGPSKELCP
jgi:hypothetical protein